MSEALTYAKKMKCLKDLGEYTAFGNYDTPKAENLMIVFEKCDPKVSKITCKTNEEIDQWMFSKFFVLFTNKREFKSYLFDQHPVVKSAKLQWYPLIGGSRVDYVLQVFRKEVELHDMIVDLGSSTMKKDRGFVVEQKPSR